MTMDGGVLDGIVITETMGDDGGIALDTSWEMMVELHLTHPEEQL